MQILISKAAAKLSEYSTSIQFGAVSGTFLGVSIESLITVLASVLFGALTVYTNYYFKCKDEVRKQRDEIRKQEKHERFMNQ